MKFSIIIPVYNVKEFLNQCLESVLSQNFKDFEIILVNDGSTDGSKEICDSFEKNEKITIVHKTNEGLSEARNDGLRIAKGEYVIFLDSDDYWDGSENLTLLNDVLTVNKNLEILSFNRTFLYNDKTFVKPKKTIRFNNKNLFTDSVFFYLINNNNFECSACLKVIKKQFLLSNNLFFKKGIKAEDIEWYMRVVLRLKTFQTINLPFYIYRAQRESSISNSVDIHTIKDLLNTIEERNIDIEKSFNKYSSLFVNCYKSYLAYQLSIIIGYSYLLSKNELLLIKSRVKKIDNILSFIVFKRTNFIRRFYLLFGYNLTSWLLYTYIYYRKTGKLSL